MLIFENPLGSSINSSLNSLMNGGKTIMKTVNIMNDIDIRTINKAINLGSFKNFWTWLHKLQTTFDMTNEQIINRKKSLNVHIINKLIKTTVNL